ncbi:hypothetical protein L0Y49_03675 [bacterium]|nr:hypothetical protein [bacterium]MCI0679802.1 hypothetical protein [bacterium]
MASKPTIGFIGQGWIGKHYADNYEARGFSVVRYSKEESYRANRDRLIQCDIILIAVPTPTLPTGFDDSILWEVAGIVPKGKTAVIKSTVIPGTTERLQEAFPDIFILHSPEFLSEATARHDVENPARNIVGIPKESEEHRRRAKIFLETLPEAPYTLLCRSKESEFIKYTNNTFLYTKVVYMNLLYDLAEKLGIPWAVIREAMANEPWIGNMHIDPVHNGGRGAGGDCYIKDFAAFKNFFMEQVPDDAAHAVLRALEKKNLDLLLRTGKNIDIVESVYGSVKTGKKSS